MYKRFFAISIFMLFSLSIASDRDCEGLPQDDCEWLDYCMWTEDGCVRVGEDDGDWEDEENWEDECRFIEDIEECLEVGCEWDEEGGCFDPDGSDDEEDWEEDECRYLESEDECIAAGCEWSDEDGCYRNWDDEEEFECEDIDNPEECVEAGCEWTGFENMLGGFCSGESDNDWDDEEEEDGPPECLMDCEGIDTINPEESGAYFCEWLLNIFPTGCAEDCEQETLDEIEMFMMVCDECLSNDNCDDVFNDEEEFECEDIDNPEECLAVGCEWNGSPNMPGGYCSGEWSDDDEEEDGGDGGGNIDFEAALMLGDGSAAPGGEVEVPLFLESIVSISGIQFTLNSNPSDWQSVVDFNLTLSEDNCFEANFNNTDEGTIALIYSLSGCEFGASDESTQIGTLTFEISEYAEWGEFIELYFTELIVASSNGSQVDAEAYGGLISIGALGDVNHDGEVNVIDAVAMVQFVLQFEEPTDSDFWASDINLDGTLNILDVVLLVEMILDN